MYKLPPALTGDAIKSARAGFDQTGKPNVSIDFTSEGSQQFQEVTRELYRTGLLKQTPQTFAIVLDNVMSSDPMIDYTKADLRDGISGGAEISGGSMTVQESKDLAFVLNTGALPVKLETAYQQEVSATLGKDSLNQGLIAGLIGLGIVLLYMLLYYRFLGLVADLALIVYAILPVGPVQPHPGDAHAARHRRHDPHHRCGRRRQRGHLRAHQGRGAPRQDGPLGGQLGLHPRLQDHPRRQRAHHPHGAWCCSCSPPPVPRASRSRSSSASS